MEVYLFEISDNFTIRRSREGISCLFTDNLFALSPIDEFMAFLRFCDESDGGSFEVAFPTDDVAFALHFSRDKIGDGIEAVGMRAAVAT